MSPAAALHAQLASIMEVLANTAVAEICELVDSGYSVLQLEISRSRKENEVLRRKLRLMELRAARAAALRAAAAAARAQPPGHHGDGPRRSATPRAEAAPPRVSDRETLRCRATGPSPGCARGGGGTRDAPPAGESTAVTAALIKVEDDDDESWSRPQQDQEFCPAADGQTIQTEAPPPQMKQEVTDERGGSTPGSWLSGEVSSASTSAQKALSTSRRSDGGGYDYVTYEPQLRHASISTQNPLSEDPGCSYAPNVSASTDSGSSDFPFPESAAEHQQPAGFQGNQQRAALPADEPQLPARKDAAPIRRDKWGHQGGAGTASDRGRADGGARTFVCNCCGKSLACLKNLKTHMRVHTGEKPFACARCGKRFSDSSNLKRHQSVHTGEKRYGCVHCGKRFAQSGSLKVHMTVHTDCKQFRCSRCGKTFISGSHLRRHAAVHAGEKRLATALQ